MFQEKFWISLALTVPTLIWGEMLPHLFHYMAPQIPGARWIAPIFGTAVFILTIIAIASALATAIVWILLGATSEYVIERVVTVLDIACPHAMGLSIPLVIAISTTLGARRGLLVRDRRGLEDARNLTTVVFDKTGTLTLGEYRVVGVVTDGERSDEDALRLAAAIEEGSEHPLARAIVASAEARGVAGATATDFRAIPGEGVEATVE
jgi:Cu2+-exporting ATPase